MYFFYNMEDEIKSPVTMESKFCSEAPSHPPSYGWQPSLLYNQHFGLPPFLEFRDLSWMESIFKRLRTSSWSGYTRSSSITLQPDLDLHRKMGGGVSEVSTQQCRWKVSLDVNHFAPSEFTIRTRDGFLEIKGHHDEREDEHGFISRHFVRKYRLPLGVEAQNIRSFITGDGVLTVEVPMPEITPPADVTVPVQVQIEAPILEDPTPVEGSRPKKIEGEEDVVVLPSAGVPEERPAAADEGICQPDDPKFRAGLGAEGEAVTRPLDEKKREEEDSAGIPEEVQESLKPEAPGAPVAPDEVTAEWGAGIQERAEGSEMSESVDEVSITQETIPSQLDVTEQQALEQIKNI